jgi:hypothetical protein
MRKVKNITVCVTPQIYRQARHLAAEYDTTVSGIVAGLLERLPDALERLHYPRGGPRRGAQPAPPSSPLGSSSPRPLPPDPIVTSPLCPSSSPTPLPPMPGRIANSGCETVPPHPTQGSSEVCSRLPDTGTAPVQLYSGA